MATEPHHRLTGEDLKAQMVELDPSRSLDAMAGAGVHPLQRHVDRSTIDFFEDSATPFETLYAPEVTAFLADPSQVRVIGCGRNEHDNGTGALVPNLRYMTASTQAAGNVHFYDAGSTDRSVEAALTVPGVEVHEREEITQLFDTQALADVLGVDQRIFQDVQVLNTPPLRKGWDIHLARANLLRDMLHGKAPETVIWTDTDLFSTPGGKAEDPTGRQTYHPLQLLSAAYLQLRDQQLDNPPHLILTASGHRNNEPVHAILNTAHALASAYPKGTDSHNMLEAISLFGAVHGHPLTGELLASTQSEIHAPGATGQLVETVRLLWHANIQYRLHGTVDPDQLQHAATLAADVKRGPQERLDKPQTEEKERWMIDGVIPQGAMVLMNYVAQTGKFFDQWTLQDYRQVNDQLARISYMSHYDNGGQTRRVHEYPMERIIPPVALLQRVGILTV